MESLQEKIQRVVAEQVELAPGNPNYPGRFKELRQWIISIAGEGYFRRIEHFGSTAVPGLLAKAIIDILLEVPDSIAAHPGIVRIFEPHGCDVFWRPAFGDDGDPWYSWVIVRDHAGKRIAHLHIVAPDSPLWERLLFRDWLRAHPEDAHEYEVVKQSALGDSKGDRIAYTDAKGAFIQGIMRKIRESQQ